MDSLIPTETLKAWRGRAKRGALELLDSLCEFREMIPDFKAEAVLMQAYAEASEALMMAPETLRDYVGKVREYPKEQMIYWITNGVSFDHFEKANTLADLAHKPPAQLLDEAINPGNATGQTMTVKELTAYALGEVSQPMKVQVYRFTVLYKQLGKFPSLYGWDDDKAARYGEWLRAGEEFFR